MRFVSSSLFIGLCLSACLVEASAQDSTPQQLPLAIDLNLQSENSLMPTLQKGRRFTNLVPADGFDVTLVGSNLGKISAITADMQGNIFAADQESGRIWSLSDRRLDGKIDKKQALVHRFDSPTGLALHGQTLYVADKNALWAIKGNRPPAIVAGLREANSTGTAHPLSVSANGSLIYMGLETRSGDVKLLSIDPENGAATLIESQKSNNAIIALVTIDDGAPWVAQSHALGASLKESQNYPARLSFTGMVDTPKSLLTIESLKGPLDENSLVASHLSPSGFNVVIVPTRFGVPQKKVFPLLSGFSGKHGRSAWGRPGPLAKDSLGLLIADDFNGDIYRITPSERQAPTAAPYPAPLSVTSNDELDKEGSHEIKAPPSGLFSTLKGSQIKTGSTLESASGLDVGSTIIKNYKPLTLEENGAADDSETAKKSTDREKRGNR